MRMEVVDQLASRPVWQPLLFESIEAGTIRATDVLPARRALLLRATGPALKARAEALFGAAAVSGRQSVLDSHARTLNLPSDPERGFAVVRRGVCAVPQVPRCRV